MPAQRRVPPRSNERARPTPDEKPRTRGVAPRSNERRTRRARPETPVNPTPRDTDRGRPLPGGSARESEEEDVASTEPEVVEPPRRPGRRAGPTRARRPTAARSRRPVRSRGGNSTP